MKAIVLTEIVPAESQHLLLGRRRTGRLQIDSCLNASAELCWSKRALLEVAAKANAYRHTIDNAIACKPPTDAV